MRIDLTDDGASWIEYYPNVLHLTPEQFEQFWNLHPETRGTIRVHGKTHEMRRWNQSYGRSYAFSGQVVQAASETPDIVQQCIDLANNREGEGGSHIYNMSLVNWYMDGNDYISPHSDDERQLIPGEPITCFSFGVTRKFRLAPKPGVEGGKKVDIEVEDGSMLVMGGTCQRTHVHSIPVSKKIKDRRISVTLRKFV